MRLKVTNKDRKNVRSTCMVFAILFILFTALTVLFAVTMPKTEQIMVLGDAGEEVKSIAEGKDGSEYFVFTDNLFCRFDSITNELKETFQMTDIGQMLKNKGDYDKLVPGSLSKWTARYVELDGEDYFIVSDSGGNIFKLSDKEGSLKIVEDYYLPSRKNTIKGCDYIDNDLFFLALESDNQFYLHKFETGDLSNGISAKKFIWDIDAGGALGSKKLTSLAASTGILAFNATDEYILIFRSNGGIIKINKDFYDIEIDGKKIDYFAEATSYYGNDHQDIYDKAYRNYFEELLLALREEKLAVNEEFAYSEEDIKLASADQLISYFEEYKSRTTVTKEKNNAKKIAETAVSEGFINANEWCLGYDESTNILTVKDEFLDANNYSVLNAGCAIHGMAYSHKNEKVYFTNATDKYLHELDLKVLKGLKNGAVIGEVSTKIGAITSGDEVFSNFGNGININRFANTLYIRYQNLRKVSIVDLNDTKNYREIYTFDGDFDTYSFTGDKDNKVTHVLHQVTTVGLDGKSSVHLMTCTYYPEKFANKALIRTLLIITIILSIITLAVTIWFGFAIKRDKSILKIKVIQNDVKKNKYIYLVLAIFVGMLCMFCYYEAIGALSMSFFDYTREKPSWIWNNFGNFLKIFNDSNFALSIRNMLFFLVSDLILCIVPPLIFAILLVLIRNKTASNWIRSLMFIPGIIPSMASMLIWREGIYGTDGILNQIVTAFGGTAIEWLNNTDFARWSLIFMGFPFVGGYLIFYGGMMNIPKEYHEAGRLEGLGTIKRFLKIDIPLIMPQIKYIFIMTFISSVQNYARTYVLGSSGTITPVESMYRIMMGTQADYGMASAYATMLFVFLFVAIAINFKMQRKESMGDDL